jgi:hypothetical protein
MCDWVTTWSQKVVVGGYLSTKSMPTVGRSSSPTSLPEEVLVVGHGIEVEGDDVEGCSRIIFLAFS